MHKKHLIVKERGPIEADLLSLGMSRWGDIQGGAIGGQNYYRLFFQFPIHATLTLLSQTWSHSNEILISPSHALFFS